MRGNLRKTCRIFQSTLPQGERLGHTGFGAEKENFNPRSRKGSDQSNGPKNVGRGISIHAPARGATIIRAPRSRGSGISIHAPARGATIFPAILDSFFIYFNPRSRKGSDGRTFFGRAVLRAISIHAPARGATLPFLQASACPGYFNPRSRKGSDLQDG